MKYNTLYQLLYFLFMLYLCYIRVIFVLCILKSIIFQDYSLCFVFFIYILQSIVHHNYKVYSTGETFPLKIYVYTSLISWVNTHIFPSRIVYFPLRSRLWSSDLVRTVQTSSRSSDYTDLSLPSTLETSTRVSNSHRSNTSRNLL